MILMTSPFRRYCYLEIEPVLNVLFCWYTIGNNTRLLTLRTSVARAPKLWRHALTNSPFPFKIKDGDKGTNMTDLFHHERVEKALKGQFSLIFIFSWKNKDSLQKFTLAVRVKLIKVLFAT